jgi:hypothetical protein
MEERFLRTGAIEPQSRRSVSPAAAALAAGVARFVALVVTAAVLSIGIALLIAWWRGSDARSAAILGLYGGGVLLIAVPLLSGGGRSYLGGGYIYYELDPDAESRRAWQGTLWAYLLVGLSLIGLGIGLETLA